MTRSVVTACSKRHRQRHAIPVLLPEAAAAPGVKPSCIGPCSTKQHKETSAPFLQLPAAQIGALRGTNVDSTSIPAVVGASRPPGTRASYLAGAGLPDWAPPGR